MKRWVGPVAWALVAASAPLAAQPSAPEPPSVTSANSFSAWFGDWVGQGVIFGQPAHATVRFAAALDGSAMVQDYALSLEGAKPRKFWGHGIYLINDKGAVTGQWTDSDGSLHDVKGRLAQGSWTIHWGSPLTEIGRTVHRMEDSRTMVIIDSVLQPDGNWRQFAEMRYTRAAK